MAFQHFKLRIGDSDGAKKMLSRSMQSLSRHKHIEVISKYAIAEFDIGSQDRGRVIFEDLLSNFPKRTDIWHVYVDQEIKHKKYHQAREIFERMVSMKVSAKNMKAVFKKYLLFETRHGNQNTKEAVQQKMRNYVLNLIS
jgi:rRNA biogenesis protein RRP5